MPWLLAAATATAYGLLAVAQYRQFAVRTWDLGIFEQAVRHYAHLQAPVADIKGPGFNLLGDHFSPMVALLAPIYRVFPSAETLLIAQAVLVGWSVVPVVRAASARLGTRRGLAIGIAYALSWGLQWAVDAEFHEVCFAVPLLAFSLEAALDRRWGRAATWALPLVLVKEDLGLTVAALGVYVVARGGIRIGAFLAGFGLAAVALQMFVLLPAVNTEGDYDYWTNLSRANPTSGPTVGGVFENLPAHLLDPQGKTFTMIMLLAITGFVAIRSPLLLLALPTLAWRFASSNAWYSTWGMHYSAVLMPIAFFALIDAMDALQHSRRRWAPAVVDNTIPAVLAIAVALTSQLPLGRLAQQATYQHDEHDRALVAASAAIPDGITVESDLGLLTHLTSRARVLWLGGAGEVIPDYVVVDAKSGWNAPRGKALLAYTSDLHLGTTYEIVFNRDGVSVLRRVPAQDSAISSGEAGTAG